MLLLVGVLQAQVTEVCAGDGTDSVTLYVSNYQYGNIQWQYSEDTLTWTDIPGANDTIFRFKPNENEALYYRAWMQYPNCPDESSVVTRVRFLPKANAGPDRILNENFVTTLFGNKVEDENTRCMWQVIEGYSANLEDPTWYNSAFSGPDTLYRLTWTLANACGVSVDTVEIRYVHTVMYDAIVLVDPTDIILSDSAEMASGIYRIVFSAPVPNITDSTILVSMTDGGFLRKVLWFEHFGDTCEMVTSQAYLSDIIVDGVMNFEIPLFSSNRATRRSSNGRTFTRSNLQQDPRFLSGRWGELINEMVGGMSGTRDFFEEYVNVGSFQLDEGWKISNVQIDTNDLTIICDYRVVLRRLYLYYKVGVIGDFRLNFTLHTEGNANVNFSKDIETPIQIPLGPVIFSIKVPITITGSCHTPQGMDIPMHITKPLDMIAEYSGALPLPTPIVGLFLPVPIPDSLSENNGRMVVSADETPSSFTFELSGSVGVKLSALLFKVIGPQFSFMPKFTWSVCEGTNGFRQAKSYFSIDTRLDIGLDLLGHFSAGYFHVWPGEEDVIHYYPYRLAMGHQTNRNLTQPSAGSWNFEPVKVNLYNWVNMPVKSGKKVLFEATGGVVSSTPSGSGSASAFAFTDDAGLAKIYWKPLASNASLKASVLDCEGNHIKGSPLYFYSNGVADPCLNSTLSLGIDNNGRFITSGGTSPFHYSSNGTSWLPEFNMSYPLAPGTYFVKDADGCVAATTNTVQESMPPCNLNTSTYQDGLHVRFEANNGTAPYHFYVDGLDYTTSGTTQRVFQHTFAQDGEYTITVTDANGCTQSTIVHLVDGVTLPTVVTSTTYHTSHNVYDQVMGAVTANGGAALTERGIQWSLSSDMSNATNVPSSFTGDGLGQYLCQISGVSAGTTYYARAYASNSKGTAYGAVITLTVLGSAITTSCGVSVIRSNETGSNGTITAVRDHQNNSYAVVQIGSQCWLKENMRCTTSPSTGANMVQNPANGTSSTVRRAYYYDNNPANAANGYGLLYNWPASMDGSTMEGARGICPEGWHLPADAEWTQLTNYVSSQSQYVCGSDNTYIAKALAATSGWNSFNSLCTVGNEPSTNNATGFSALPSGVYLGNYYALGNRTDFWSATQIYGSSAYRRNLNSSSTSLDRYYNTKDGCYSVRCLRNDEGTSAAVLPTISTSAVGNVTSTTATCGGNVTSDGGANVTERGVCWSTSQNPTISDSHTVDGSGVGSFISNISGLTAGVTYYVRAYATNSVGTAYGDEVSLTVPGSSNVDEVVVSFNGSTWVAADILLVEDHSTDGYITIAIEKTQRCSRNNTDVYLLGFLKNTTGSWTYSSSGGHYCLYRDPSYIYRDANGVLGNAGGAYWGWNEVKNSFVENITEIDLNNMTISGTFSQDFFDIADYIAAGNTIPTNRKTLTVTLNNAHFNDTSAVTGATVTTAVVSNITSTSATCGGNVTSDGGANVTARGVCWSTHHNPTISDSHTDDGSGTGSFTSGMTGLFPNTTYYVRAYAVNSVGTRYGNEVSFTTSNIEYGQPCPNATTVTDIDGNTYNTVQIGQQCWMKENLRTRHFADGTGISADGTQVSANMASFLYYCSDEPFFYVPNKNFSCVPTYGYLYNYAAVMHGATPSDANPSGVQGICPTGWHVPSDAEWTQLTNFVSGQSQYWCGGNNTYVAKALSAISADWIISSNACAIGNDLIANNRTGFSAFPAGRFSSGSLLASGANCGTYESFGNSACFWSSTQHYYSEYYAYGIELFYENTFVGKQLNSKDLFSKIDALSVRCLRD